MNTCKTRTVLIAITIALLIMGCANPAVASTVNPTETMPPLATPPPRPTIQPTPEPEVRTFELNWQPIEATLYKEQIPGTILLFNQQEFMMFIPQIFHQTYDVTLGHVPDAYELIAVYQTADEDYTLTISHGPLTDGLENLNDIAEAFKYDTNKTICHAIINGISFLDIEDYKNNTLQLIVKASDLSAKAIDNDYITFLFEPMDAADYVDITISMISSILPMYPESLPKNNESETETESSTEAETELLEQETETETLSEDISETETTEELS